MAFPIRNAADSDTAAVAHGAGAQAGNAGPPSPTLETLGPAKPAARWDFHGADREAAQRVDEHVQPGCRGRADGGALWTGSYSVSPKSSVRPSRAVPTRPWPSCWWRPVRKAPTRAGRSERPGSETEKGRRCRSRLRRLSIAAWETNLRRSRSSFATASVNVSPGKGDTHAFHPSCIVTAALASPGSKRSPVRHSRRCLFTLIGSPATFGNPCAGPCGGSAATPRLIPSDQVERVPVLRRIASNGAQLFDLGTEHGLRTVFARNGSVFQVFYVTADVNGARSSGVYHPLHPFSARATRPVRHQN